MAIASQDTPRLRSLVQTAIKNGSSVDTIITKMKQALNGTYHSQNYTCHELDIAYLVKAIGGPALLHSMGRTFGLPPSTTTMCNKCVPHLLPSVARPTKDEIFYNINTFFGPEAIPEPHKASGFCMMVDDVALDPSVAFLREQNKFLGICREHGSRCDLIVRNIESIDAVADAL